MKKCTRCKVEKPLDLFSFREGGKYKSHCKECTSAGNLSRYYQLGGHAARKDRAYRYNLKKNYGLTIDQYNTMLEEQGQVCKICKEAEEGKRLFVDHCHSTGHVRGLLCSKCNTGLGQFKDSVDLLEEAIRYLNESRDRYRDFLGSQDDLGGVDKEL